MLEGCLPLIMFSRSFFARIVWSLSLTALCLPGFGADTNSLEAAAPAITQRNDDVTNAPAPPEPAKAGAVPEVNSAWVLSPNDGIAMTVFSEEDLSAKTTIDVNGLVMLPLLGEVKIGGMTLGQATTRIQQLYNQDYLVNPQVNLVVEKFAARHFSVLGQVQRPGSFDFPQNEPVNLLQAIAMAGGYTRLGAPSKVSVRRVENGAPKIYRLNAEEISQDQKKKSFDVLPNDIITVGERTF
jgi:polysaccharide export outer membrane protein